MGASRVGWRCSYVGLVEQLENQGNDPGHGPEQTVAKAIGYQKVSRVNLPASAFSLSVSALNLRDSSLSLIDFGYQLADRSVDLFQLHLGQALGCNRGRSFSGGVRLAV